MGKSTAECGGVSSPRLRAQGLKRCWHGSVRIVVENTTGLEFFTRFALEDFAFDLQAVRDWTAIDWLPTPGRAVTQELDFTMTYNLVRPAHVD